MDIADLRVVKGDPTSEELAAVIIAILWADSARRTVPSAARPAAQVGAGWHGPAAWSPSDESWSPAGRPGG